MPSRAQIRKAFDFGRMRYGMKGPGSDTRAWVSMARIDDDPDAIRWEPKIGWIADVTFIGGPLDQVGPVPCRVLQSFGTDGSSRTEPVHRKDHVLVLVVDGDPNVGPVIAGAVHTEGDAVATAVNGQNIDEAFGLTTHILKSKHSIESEVEGKQRAQSHGTMTFIAPLLELTQNAPTQAFVRGSDFADAIKDMLDSIKTLVSVLNGWSMTVGGGLTTPLTPPAIAAVQVAGQNAISAISDFESKLIPGDLLSNKIKGE